MRRKRGKGWGGGCELPAAASARTLAPNAVSLSLCMCPAPPPVRLSSAHALPLPRSCIPVIIQDQVHLGFESILDFASFTVRIAEKDLARVPQVRCSLAILLVVCWPASAWQDRVLQQAGEMSWTAVKCSTSCLCAQRSLKPR